jgi:hypothetical protein
LENDTDYHVYRRMRMRPRSHEKRADPYQAVVTLAALHLWL